MLIFAIDAATKSGFCYGRDGEKPRVWSQRLKRPDDPPERAFRKMGMVLRDQFAFEKPDLVIVEAPREMGANIKADDASPRGFKFTTNQSTANMLIGLWAVAYGICGPYGLDCASANVQTVRKQALGNSRPQNPKEYVLGFCKDRGYVGVDCKDDNMADAVVLWIYACIAYAGQVTAPMQRFRPDDPPGSIPFTGSLASLPFVGEGRQS